MKRILSKLMGLTLMAMLLFAAAGIRLNAGTAASTRAANQPTQSRQLSDKKSQEIVGGLICAPVVIQNAKWIAILGSPALAVLYLATHCEQI